MTDNKKTFEQKVRDVVYSHATPEHAIDDAVKKILEAHADELRETKDDINNQAVITEVDPEMLGSFYLGFQEALNMVNQILDKRFGTTK